MENMENVMMETTSEIPAEVGGTNLGGKILGGVLIGGAIVGVGTLARKAYKWTKNKIAAKKAKKADVVDPEYVEADVEA